MLGCVNRWLVFVFLLTLVFAATTRAQDDSFDPTESYRATDYNGNTTRITPSALGGYNATDSEGNVTRIRPSALGGYNATDSEGNVTRIRPSALGGYNATDSEGNVTRIRPSALGGYNAIDSEGNRTRIKPMGFGSRSSYDRAPVDADDYESDDSSSYAYSRHSSDAQEDDGFAAASGKCGDVTTQKIGSFYYDSDGGVTQRIGSFYYHSGGKPCEDDEEN